MVNNAGDATGEYSNEGYDTVEVHTGALTNGGYTRQANIERGALAEDVGVGGLLGNAESNKLDGNSASNTLQGGGGHDQLYGYGGDDTLIGNGDNESDLLYGGVGFDTYHAGNSDVVQDTDQRGTVNFAGTRLRGGIYSGKFGNADVFKDAFTSTTYYYDTTSKTLTDLRAGESLKLSNFRNMQDPRDFLAFNGMNLGIRLEGAPARSQQPAGG